PHKPEPLQPAQRTRFKPYHVLHVEGDTQQTGADNKNKCKECSSVHRFSSPRHELRYCSRNSLNGSVSAASMRFCSARDSLLAAISAASTLASIPSSRSVFWCLMAISMVQSRWPRPEA